MPCADLTHHARYLDVDSSPARSSAARSRSFDRRVVRARSLWCRALAVVRSPRRPPPPPPLRYAMKVLCKKQVKQGCAHHLCDNERAALRRLGESDTPFAVSLKCAATSASLATAHAPAAVAAHVPAALRVRRRRTRPAGPFRGRSRPSPHASAAFASTADNARRGVVHWATGACRRAATRDAPDTQRDSSP